MNEFDDILMVSIGTEKRFYGQTIMPEDNFVNHLSNWLHFLEACVEYQLTQRAEWISKMEEGGNYEKMTRVVAGFEISDRKVDKFNDAIQTFETLSKVVVWGSEIKDPYRKPVPDISASKVMDALMVVSTEFVHLGGMNEIVKLNETVYHEVDMMTASIRFYGTLSEFGKDENVIIKKLNSSFVNPEEIK